MTTFWLDPASARTLGSLSASDGIAVLRSALARTQDETPARASKNLAREVTLVRVPAVRHGWRLELSPSAPVSAEAHAVVLSATLLDEPEAAWTVLLPRIVDAVDIVEARRRPGLQFVQQDAVASIFAPGGYHRVNLHVDAARKLTVMLERTKAEAWTTHSGARTVRQPSPQHTKQWRLLHDTCAASYSRATPAAEAIAPLDDARPARAAPRVPEPTGWITPAQLRDLGLREETVLELVCQARTQDEFAELIEVLPDALFDKLEARFSARLERLEREEGAGSFLEVCALDARPRSSDEEGTLETWLGRLNADQRRVVTLERPGPIRLRGGPGTGKTLVALLRAAWLLEAA